MSVYPSVSKSVFKSVHNPLKVPAALLGSGGGGSPPFDPDLASIQSRILDGGTIWTDAISGKYYLKDQSTDNTHLPRQGRAWLFDGTNDRAVASSASLFSFIQNTKIFTICGWVKLINAAERAIIASTPSGSEKGFYWSRLASKKIDFVLSNGTTSYGSVTSTGDVLDNTWTFIAVTGDGSRSRVYINGALDATGSVSALSSTGDHTRPVRIGAFNDWSGFMNGSFRGFRIYSGTKSDAEVLAIYNQSLTGNGTLDTTDAEAIWPCNEESGTTGYDISGNANHLTLTNITEATFHSADTGVLTNRNNDEGYRLSGSVYIPKRLSDSLAADGNALTVTGRAAYHGCAEVPCITGNGSTVYADLGANISIPGEHTACAWIKSPTVSAGTMAIISNSNTGGSEIDYQLEINRSGGKVSALANGATVAITSTGSIAIDTWTHVGVVKSGSAGNWTFKIYINGVLDSTATTSQNANGTTDSRFAIARLGAANFLYFSGSIADARLFSVAKSDSEILAIYQGASDTASLQGRWPIQEGPGSSNTNRTIYDVSGNSRNLTIVNGTVSTIWGNRVPGQVKDWCIDNGGRIGAGGEYIAGLIGSANAADGNAKTLSAGKFGNPFSRINLNPATAAEFNGRSIPTASAVANDINAAVTPAESAFRRTDTDGDDRFLIYESALTGSDLTNVEAYVA